MKPFEWTAKSEEAAVLVAEDRKTDEQISAIVGIVRKTLHNWRENEEFQARVNSHRSVFARRVMQNGIARVERRVEALQDRWDRMRALMDARSEEHAAIPGGGTGLLVRTQKALGSGPGAVFIDEYAVDTGLLRELREHEKQAAQELGQWIEKQEHAGPNGAPISVSLALQGAVLKAYGDDSGSSGD